MVLARTMDYGNGTISLIDIKDNIFKHISTEEVKSKIISGQLDVIDKQIDKAGRLVSKKVEYKNLCRQIYFFTGKEYTDINGKKHKEYKIRMLSIEEQQLILFYGLARIHQLSKQAKQKLYTKIKSLNSIDERDLNYLIIDSGVYTFERYCNLDTACSDKVIDFMYLVAESKYTPNYMQF